MYIDLIYRLANRPEKGKAPKIDFNQFNGSQSSAEVRLKQYSVINWIRHRNVFCGLRPNDPWSLFDHFLLLFRCISQFCILYNFLFKIEL